MLTYKQIAKRITNMIQEKFPNIDVNSSDTEEGFKRPSFTITFDDLRRTSYKYYSIREMTIRVFYFPSNRHEYAIEVLDVQQNLEELFDQDLLIENRVIPIAETRHQLIDKVLEFEIEIEYYEEPLPSSEPEPPLMGGLDYNG